MDQEYFRTFARRCRELMRRTTSERAREQLCLWAAEFDARAMAWDSGHGASGCDNPDIAQPAKPVGPHSPRREATR